MILRDCIVRSGIVDSARVCALPVACQLFFRNLLHACDGAGRFPADADELRNAFYWRSPGVSKPHVEAWLTKCHQAGLVKLYTSGGKAYGGMPNYGQRDTKRRVLYPPPDDGELNFAVSLDPDDPPASKPKKKRNEVKGRESAREAPAALPAPAVENLSESHEAWLARLQVAWPHLDVRAEAVKAYVKKSKRGEQLERGWFEASWLPKCTETVTNRALFAPQAASAMTQGEPEGWRAVLAGTVLGDAIDAGEIGGWDELNKTQRDFVYQRIGDMRRAG